MLPTSYHERSQARMTQQKFAVLLEHLEQMSIAVRSPPRLGKTAGLKQEECVSELYHRIIGAFAELKLKRNTWDSFKNLIILSLLQNDINWPVNLQKCPCECKQNVSFVDFGREKKPDACFSQEVPLQCCQEPCRAFLESFGRWCYNSNKMKQASKSIHIPLS